MNNHRALILIDHSNIPWDTISVTDILRQWTRPMASDSATRFVMFLVVRAYGGWFDGDLTSSDRFAAATFYQDTCPALFETGKMTASVRFEFADTLSPWGVTVASRLAITHTVASRRAPGRYLLTKAATCTNAKCQLKLLRKWSRSKRACQEPTCKMDFADCVVRPEQKQVDVHMALDLVAAAGSGLFQSIAVASDDADLALLRIAAPISYLDGRLTSLGVRLVRIRP